MFYPQTILMVLRPVTIKQSFSLIISIRDVDILKLIAANTILQRALWIICKILPHL